MHCTGSREPRSQQRSLRLELGRRSDLACLPGREQPGQHRRDHGQADRRQHHDPVQPRDVVQIRIQATHRHQPQPGQAQADQAAADADHAGLDQVLGEQLAARRAQRPAQADLAGLAHELGKQQADGVDQTDDEEGKRKSDLDLRIAKRKYGKDALYTLQVGFYGREELNRLSPEDKKAIQVAAEQAAADLRRDGELAFYYHGAHRSVVTVGVFGADDFDPMNPAAESRRLSETRRRHPLNLYNGQGYTGKTPGMREAKLVPSALVAVPER